MNRRKFVLTSVTLLGGIPIARFGLTGDTFKPVRFGIVTDMHYADRPAQGSRYYQQSLAKTRECVELMNEQKVDFLIELGDLKDQGEHPDEAQTLAFLDTIEKELRRFNGPLYHVLGNHDADSISKDQFLSRIRNDGFSRASGYYSFNQASFHFVVLDADYTSKGVAYDHGNFDWRDCYIPGKQLHWLKKDLQKHKRPTIVFVHQQLDSAAFPVKHRINCVSNADAVRKVLEESGNVRIVFQGHFHPGSFNEINDIYYYTLKAVIEGSGAGNNSYAIVEIGEDRIIRVKGFRKAESKELT